jgi:hypothetical protein
MAKKFYKLSVVWFRHPQVSAHHHVARQNEKAFCHSVMRPVTSYDSCRSSPHFAPDQIASPRRPGPSKGPPPLNSTDAQRAHCKAMYKIMQDL